MPNCSIKAQDAHFALSLLLSIWSEWIDSPYDGPLIFLVPPSSFGLLVRFERIKIIAYSRIHRGLVLVKWYKIPWWRSVEETGKGLLEIHRKSSATALMSRDENEYIVYIKHFPKDAVSFWSRPWITLRGLGSQPPRHCLLLLRSLYTFQYHSITTALARAGCVPGRLAFDGLDLYSKR
jgi:hypothetical protein